MEESGVTLLDNLMGEMNVEEYEKVFVQQIQNQDEDYTSPCIDHFSELYRRYVTVFEYDDLDEDKLAELAARFEQICKTIILCINSKFDTDIDVDRICEADGNLAGVTLALYLFFVIELKSNITSIIRNYLVKHGLEIYNAFAHLESKKDVVTTSNKTNMSIQMAIVASNIYDISDHILSLLDSDTITSYCDEGYLTGELIHKLVTEDKLPGNFALAIADLYKNNTDLKARVGFDILYAIKNGDISDDIFNPPAPQAVEETE